MPNLIVVSGNPNVGKNWFASIATKENYLVIDTSKMLADIYRFSNSHLNLTAKGLEEEKRKNQNTRNAIIRVGTEIDNLIIPLIVTQLDNKSNYIIPSIKNQNHLDGLKDWISSNSLSYNIYTVLIKRANTHPDVREELKNPDFIIYNRSASQYSKDVISLLKTIK